MSQRRNNKAAGGPAKKRKVRDTDRNRWIGAVADILRTFSTNNPGVAPASPALETEVVPGQEDWNENNLPDILF
jgi:hypothetical protein